MARAKKLFITLAVTVCCVFATLGLAACSSYSAGESPDAPPTMGAGHSDRYATLGAAGCYGCHGNNSEGKTMLTQATAMPADHYATGNGTSAKDLAGEHTTCNTCHVPGN